MQLRASRKTAYLGLLTALAAILGYLESLLPLTPAIPGMKPGLSNIVICFVLCTFGPAAALAVSAARILLVGFLFASLTGILYSLAGTCLAIMTMTILRRSGRFSLLGISAGGGAAHNLGQLLMARLLLPELPFADYLPYLLLAGVAAGTLIGLLLLILQPYLEQLPDHKTWPPPDKPQ